MTRIVISRLAGKEYKLSLIDKKREITLKPIKKIALCSGEVVSTYELENVKQTADSWFKIFRAKKGS